MPSKKLTMNSKKLSDECLSPTTLEIVIDDDIDSDLFDEDSNIPASLKSAVTDEENHIHRRWKDVTIKNSKSHRLIEKRRRDRMNRSLDVLLNLIPHKKPENQRRIEKTEIVEMAIKYIRCLLTSDQKSLEPISVEKKFNSKIDVYRVGYNNGIGDIYDYVKTNIKDQKLLYDLFEYIKLKEIELKDLVVVSDRKTEFKAPKKECDTSDIPIESKNHSNQQANVPVFVLHPSGTHYIPMCIDSSIVAKAFNNQTNLSQNSLVSEQLHCHPVSIPVNFNPKSAVSDQYELDIQNINVVGTKL